MRDQEKTSRQPKDLLSNSNKLIINANLVQLFQKGIDREKALSQAGELIEILDPVLPVSITHFMTYLAQKDPEAYFQKHPESRGLQLSQFLIWKTLSHDEKGNFSALIALQEISLQRFLLSGRSILPPEILMLSYRSPSDIISLGRAFPTSIKKQNGRLGVDYKVLNY